MRHTRAFAVLLVTAAVSAPAVADAQIRSRVPPRAPARGVIVRPPMTAGPAYRPYVRPFRGGGPVRGGAYYGAPWYYGGWGYSPLWGYPALGWGYPATGFGAGFGYGRFGYGGLGYSSLAVGGYGYPVRPWGGVRIDIPQQDAQVYVDGYYAGIVNEFDGRFQQLNLEPGAHRIEIRADGFEPVSFEVNAAAGRTITYRASLRPLTP